MSWDVEGEHWLNTANPIIDQVYQSLLTAANLDEAKLRTVELMLDLLGYRFESALKRSIDLSSLFDTYGQEESP